MPTYTVRYGIQVRMLGERGRGVGARRRSVHHAVPADNRRAVCGYIPRFDWSEPLEPEAEVTCPRCKHKLTRKVA